MNRHTRELALKKMKECRQPEKYAAAAAAKIRKGVCSQKGKALKEKK
jgi:hypothetical protein